MPEAVCEREALIAAKAEAILGTKPDRMTNPVTVLASPAWRGVEGDVWLAEAVGQSAIVKQYHGDTAFYVDQSAAISAAKEAGKLGVGPKVLAAWNDEGVVAFEHLASPWEAGGLHHTLDADIRSSVIEQKKVFQGSAQIARTTNIFHEIAVLHAITEKEKITTHKDIQPFMDFACKAEARIRSLGNDTRPCHRDGNTANLMVNSDKSVMLIDFDLSANCDPFEDLGAYLIEVYESDVDARAGFEEWYGSFDEGLFQRAMIYGLLDDLRWGLIGSIMGAQSNRTALEFTKYAAWRFIRLQGQAKRSDANDRIRLAA